MIFVKRIRSFQVEFETADHKSWASRLRDLRVGFVFGSIGPVTDPKSGKPRQLFMLHVILFWARAQISLFL